MPILSTRVRPHRRACRCSKSIALGGAYGGNQVGQQMGQPAGFQIDVRMSDGSTRAFNVPTPGELRPGDRVQVNGSQLARY